MRKTTTIILSALFMASAAQAQDMLASSSIVDLGQVQYSKPATGVFDLRNTSSQPLQVTKVDTGCGCTLASYPTTEVAPGGSFTIQVTYDARLMGHFDKVIDVYGSTSDQPLQLDLRGVVVEEVTEFVGDFPFKMGSLTADCNYIEFEDVRKGEVFQQHFHIYNPTSQTVEPQIMHLPAYLKADVSPSKVRPNKSAEVTITLDSRKINEYGLLQTRVYVGANPGEKVAANKEIGVSTVIMPATEYHSAAELANAPHISLSETDINLPIADGKKKSATIEVTNTGNSSLVIQNVQMFTMGLNVSLNKTTIAPGESAKLKISTDPKQLRNVKTLPRVLLITNDPEQGKIIVNVRTK